MEIEAGKFYVDGNGRRVGPMALTTNPPLPGFHWYTKRFGGNAAHWSDDGTYYYPDYGQHSLAAEWTDESTGPVRTVTHKEIVLGKYGIIDLTAKCKDAVCVSTLAPSTWRTAAELRAAAATLSEIADALSEPPHA